MASSAAGEAQVTMTSTTLSSMKMTAAQLADISLGYVGRQLATLHGLYALRLAKPH